jgi:hypothetical protein
MRVVIEHDNRGAITAIAFVESQSPELELTPATGMQVIYANPVTLGLPGDLSNYSTEEIAWRRSQILNSFRIEDENLVRIDSRSDLN